jgi:ParB family chromosome partitioning protein
MNEPFKVKLIDVTLIEPSELQMRHVTKYGDIEDLMQSIGTVGILCPLIVVPEGKKYKIIAGDRRYNACSQLNIKQVPCVVCDVDDEKQIQYMTHENYYRQDVSTVDEAVYFKLILSKQKWSQKKLADIIGKSESYVSERVAIIDYPTFLMKALTEKEITFSVARELAKVRNESIMQMLVEQAVNNGCTPALAKSWREQYNILEDTVEGQELSKVVGMLPLASVTNNPLTCDICGRADVDFIEPITVMVCPECRQKSFVDDVTNPTD